MNLILDEEHEAFRRSVRGFMEAACPPAKVHAQMDAAGGYDADVWPQMCEQLALPALPIPEKYGGSGAGAVEVAIVMEEMGRVLLGTPYLSTVVIAAAILLHDPDDPAATDLLARIAAGRVTIATEMPEPTGGGEPAVTAQLAGDGWRLRGRLDYVIDGAAADLLLVPARTHSGPRVFVVDTADTGVQRVALTTLDRTRPQACVELREAAAVPVGNADSATRGVAHALDLAAVAIAAEQVGGASRCLEMSVDYARMRHQFGRPIGSFQAVKHMCADMLVDVESARSAVLYAAWVADNEPRTLPTAASLAKACASDAFTRVAATTIQVHGGIGFTWEHEAHLYYRRAHSTAWLFGDSGWHRRRLGRTLGLA